MTDANGEVEFLTRFPGGIPAAPVTSNFQVFLGSMLQATSQFTYPVAEKNALLTTHAPYTTWGADPLDFTTDGIFRTLPCRRHAHIPTRPRRIAESFLEVTINGTGTAGRGNSSNRRPVASSSWDRTSPNPYVDATTIPFTLKNASDVVLDSSIWAERRWPPSSATTCPGNIGSHRL